MSHWAAQRRLRTVTFTSLVVLGVLLALVTVLFRSFVADEQAALDELSRASHMHRLLDRALALVVDGETAQRGYELTNDAQFLHPLEESRRELPPCLDALDALLDSEHEAAAARALREAVDARVAWTEDMVALAQRGEIDSVRARSATHGGIELTDRVRALVREIGEREDERARIREDRVDASRDRFQLAFGSLVLIAIAMLGTTAFVLRRELGRLAVQSRDAEQRERRFRTIAESASDLVRVHRRDGSVVYASPSSVRLLGYTPEELVARPPFTLLPEEDRPRVRTLLERVFATGQPAETIRHGLIRKDGVVRTFETRVDLALDEEGQMYQTISRDVTERAAEEQRLAERATSDALTGLVNAGAFTEQATSLLERCERDGKQALLAFCDVNGLKVINDRLGHDAGDAVIVDAARLLRSSARDTDLVARLGGDEFVVLGVVPDQSAAEAFSRRLDERVRAHNGDASRPYRVSISVGTAVLKPGEGTTLESLRAAADAAMYRNKRARRGEETTMSGETLVRPRGAPQSDG